MNSFMKQFGKMGGKLPAPSGGSMGLAGVVTAAGLFGYSAYNSVFTVNGGERGVVFNRLPGALGGGVKKEIYQEGTHFCAPWFQRPYIFDTRIRPTTLRSPTGTKDLQMVDITLRVLYKPVKEALPQILSELGEDYDQRVLTSIANETLKSVVAQFNAIQLITQREQVSKLIMRNLTERAADFNIIIQDVSITHSTFGKEYRAAVEAKQVAQQSAERAKYLVKQAEQDKKSTIIQAQGEADSIQLIGTAMAKNPGYIQLRQLRAASAIAEVMSKSNNEMVLDSDSLLLNILNEGSSNERLRL